MGAVSSTGIASETGEPEKRSGTNIPSATLNSYREAALPVTNKKIMSEITHIESHLDVKQDKDSCIGPEREPSSSERQSPQTSNHLSNKASSAATEEQFESLEHHLDTSMQIPNSNSGVLAQESKILRDEPADLHLSRSPDVGVKTSSKCDGEKTTEKTEMVEGTSLPAESDNGAPAAHPDEHMLTKSSQPGKALEKLHPRRNPDAGGCSSQPDQGAITPIDSRKDSGLPNEETHPDDATNHSLMSQEEKVSNTKEESVSQNFVQTPSLNIGDSVPQPGQESYAYSTKFEKVEKLQPRRNLDIVVQESKSDVGSTPSKAPDKGLDDGYNWRKYGQKLVKGNKFVRSYYKCTYPNCQAKKQVERSDDGCKSDINYLGNHHHQKSQQSPQTTSVHQVRTPEMPVASTSKTNAEVMAKDASLNQHMRPTVTSPQSTVERSADGLSGADSGSNYNTRDLHDCPDPKRQKRDASSTDDDVVNRSSSDSRQVVQTLSEVDLVNDGYRWRKYGQKLVKGNPNPRSYYRCSTAGCPVKKHVERASHDSKLVITTYEGKHDHGIPTSRTVSQSTARDDPNMIITNGEPSSKPEDNGPVSLERVVHVTAN